MNKKLLRKKLALMLATLKKKRKYYCEVEYLEGTGTQYIDTGLDYFADFEIGIQLRNNVSNKALGNGGYYCMQRQNSATPTWQFTSGSGNFYNSTTSITEHHVMKWKDNKVYSDDVLLTEFIKGSNTPNRMYLYTTGVNNKYPNIIYFCKLWNPDNGVLVRDLIPVLDWDMKPCMYDRVTEQLFYNQATSGDDFSYGREIHYVDYLESTGTQYIDTGFKPNPKKLKFEFSFMPTSITGNHFAFGCRPDTSAGASSCTAYQGGGTLRKDWASSSSYFTTRLTTTDKFLYTAENNVISLNDETYTGSTQKTDSYLTYNFMLFTVNTGGTVDNRLLEAKVYYAKLWDDGKLVRDFIPAIDENDTFFMFDKITHTAYNNAGSGSFIGPTVAKDEQGKIVEPEYE